MPRGTRCRLHSTVNSPSCVGPATGRRRRSTEPIVNGEGVIVVVVGLAVCGSESLAGHRRLSAYSSRGKLTRVHPSICVRRRPRRPDIRADNRPGRRRPLDDNLSPDSAASPDAKPAAVDERPRADRPTDRAAPVCSPDGPIPADSHSRRWQVGQNRTESESRSSPRGP